MWGTQGRLGGSWRQKILGGDARTRKGDLEGSSGKKVVQLRQIQSGYFWGIWKKKKTGKKGQFSILIAQMGNLKEKVKPEAQRRHRNWHGN